MSAVTRAKLALALLVAALPLSEEVPGWPTVASPADVVSVLLPVGSGDTDVSGGRAAGGIRLKGRMHIPTLLRGEPTAPAVLLLPGVPPVDASLSRVRETALRAGRLPAPREVRRDLPRRLDAAVLAALSRDPDDRPASAEELGRALIDARTAARGQRAVTRILVADDDEAIRKLIIHALGTAFPRVEIIACADGSDALRVAESEVLSLAVVDLQMPGLTGLELTMAIRATETTSRVPIIVATAVGGAADWRVLSAVGADAFLVKPFAVKELVATAKRVLGLD